VTGLAVELDDRVLAVARDGKLLSSEPSAVCGVAEEPAELLVGAAAWDRARSMPTLTSTHHMSAVLVPADGERTGSRLLAAELQRRLAAVTAEGVTPMAESSSEPVWLVTPARANTVGLSQLLGLARRLSVPVAGFVDAAVISTAALDCTGPVIVLQLGLHHAGAVLVDAAGGQARRRRSLVADGCGLLELYQAWLDLIRATLIRHTRFDPLHSATGEQELFSALPALIAEVATNSVAQVQVHDGSRHYQVDLSLEQLTRAAQLLIGKLSELAHRLRPAGTPVDLIVPRLVAALPGMQAALGSFHNCRLILLPEGFAAAAASSGVLPESQQERVWWLRALRKLPSERWQAEVNTQVPTSAAQGAAPSHVLVASQVYPVGETVLIGREVEGPATIRVADGLPGVSRRHCTLLHDGGQVTLLDHSSFGTFVNNERVVERVRVYAGDQIRLGEPGTTLTLIVLGGGATPG
jgi:hypothetical protein